MAELSDRDKQILLGQARIEDEHLTALEREATDPVARELSACEARKMSAIFFLITGIALVFGGFWLNGPRIGFEKSIGVAALVIGGAWYFYLRSKERKLRARQAQPG